MYCEDYPCCGHTDNDGGCDWTSPYEEVICRTCLEARAKYPYHNRVNGCPTQRAKAMNAVRAATICLSCNEEPAEIMSEGQPMCLDCESNMLSFMREMQEQYDDTWNTKIGY